MTPTLPSMYFNELNARRHLDLRQALRRLQRDLDASVTGLLHERDVVEFAGDAEALPRDPLHYFTTVTGFEAIKGRDGYVHDAALVRVRVPGRTLSMTLVALGITALDAAAVFDRIEVAVEELEELLTI